MHNVGHFAHIHNAPHFGPLPPAIHAHILSHLAEETIRHAIIDGTEDLKNDQENI